MDGIPEAVEAARRADVVILAYYDVDMDLVMTPGEVQLMAGPSSAVLPLATSFEVTGEALRLTSRTAHLTPSTVVYL